VPLGAVPRVVVREVGAELGRVYDVAPRPQPAQDRPRYALNETRGQYNCAAILRRLGQRASQEAPVIGITDVDLFVADAEFVLGEADRGSNSAVVSTARLAHGPPGLYVPSEQLARRAAVEAVCRLGQLLGLSHCSDARCALHLAHGAADVDRKGPRLCHACRAALGLTGSAQ
jgi:archaemetzincin